MKTNIPPLERLSIEERQNAIEQMSGEERKELFMQFLARMTEAQKAELWEMICQEVDT